MSPRANRIITKGIGVYAIRILQPKPWWPTSPRASQYKPTCP